MAKPTVVVTRAIPEPALDRLAQSCTVDAGRVDAACPREALLARVREADGLICLLTDRIDEEVLRVAPRLRVVANVAVGFDNVDVAAAHARGIPVTNTPGVLTDATADQAFALLLGVARRVPEADRYVREGKFQAWLMMGLLGFDLAGRTLGIAGFGRIGQAVARRARGFGMRVIYTGNRRAPEALERELGATFVDKASLLAQADVVSLHVPLTSATRHYLGAAEFALMKPTAVVINTARGPVVDEAALVEALVGGRIAGAGLDVFEQEPHVHPGLFGRSDVVLAPHLGSATTETRTRMAMMAVENVLAVLAGHAPLNPVPTL
jgi:glyoxylate reductase